MSDFWTSEKGYKIYKNGPIGKKVLEQKCPEDCVSVKMGDGTCDQECNTIACLWDGDDCDGVLPEGMALDMYRLNSGNFGIFYHSEFYSILSSRKGSVLKIIQNDTNIRHQL